MENPHIVTKGQFCYWPNIQYKALRDIWAIRPRLMWIKTNQGREKMSPFVKRLWEMDGFKQGLLEFEGFDGTGHGGTPQTILTFCHLCWL